MGLEFLRDKKGAFEQRRDASISRELDVDLLTMSSDDVACQVFRCQLSEDNVRIEPGLKLVLRAFSESSMVISQSGKTIGFIVCDDLLKLAELMKKSKTHTGILTVTATNTPDFTGEFSIRPCKPFKL